MKLRPGGYLIAAVAVFLIGVAIVATTQRRRPRVATPPVIVAANPPSPVLPPLPTGTPVEISSTVSKPGLLIEVVDHDGRAVPGARLFALWTYRPYFATTDDQGRAFVGFQELAFSSTGIAMLRAEHDRFAPAVAKVRSGEAFIRIKLGPGAIVIVTVVGEAEQPLPAAEVVVDELESGFMSGPWIRARKVDAEGILRITGIPPGALVVRATAPGFEEGRKLITVQADEPRSLRLKLNRGRRLNVTVRSSAGRPLSDAKVELRHEHGGMSWSLQEGYKTFYWTRQTDGSGVASFDSLPATFQKGWLTATGPNEPIKGVEVVLSGPVTDTEITLEAGATLVVDVVDHQQASVACKVTLSGQGVDGNKEKAAGSKATFPALPAGPRIQLVVLRNGAYVYCETGIVLAPSESRDITVQLPQQYRIRVVARDTEGEPVGGRLQLTRQSGTGTPVPGITDTHLSYRTEIGADGVGEIAVYSGAYKVVFTPIDGARLEKNFTVEGDAPLDLEVNIGKRVSGFVQDSSGQPASVRVQWYESHGSWLAVTDAQGRFDLKRIPGVSGKLFLMASGVKVLVHDGPPPAEFRLMFPMSVIQGRVVGPDGQPASAVMSCGPFTSPGWQGDSESTVPFSTKQDGTFEIRVPSGKWRFYVFGEEVHPGVSHEFQVDASAPGGTVQATFTLAPTPPAK